MGWFATGPYLLPGLHRTEWGIKGEESATSPAMFQAVPTSRSPCPTLEKVRGLQSFDDAPILWSPLQSAIYFSNYKEFYKVWECRKGVGFYDTYEAVSRGSGLLQRAPPSRGGSGQPHLTSGSTEMGMKTSSFPIR